MQISMKEEKLLHLKTIMVNLIPLYTKSNTLAFDSRKLDYKEYTFTIDRLPSFRTYRIKLALTSTSQCFVPKSERT